jgi:hypothetical protein
MDQPYFHVSFRPNFRLVSTVRRFTEEFYQRMLGDHDTSERVALATHELLENAIAYASDDETGVRVELGDDYVVVKTWNRTSRERLTSLKTMIDEMNEAADPNAYYQTLMNKTAYRTEGSGLGLARIRAEADMSISYEITTDRVCIAARTTVKRKETAAP